MSVVGPRPALPNEVATYNDYQRQRLLVKPGVPVIGRRDEIATPSPLTSGSIWACGARSGRWLWLDLAGREEAVQCKI